MDPRRGSYRKALSHSDYRRVLAGLTVSQVGDWAYNVALVVFVFNATHSATWVGITTGMRMAPYVLFGALGGEIADRFERRRVMIVCDLIRIVLMLLLAAVAQTGAPVVLAGVIGFFTTTAGTPYLPSTSAMTPELVGEADLAAANGIESAVQNTSIIVGPAIGALILAVGSPALAFIVNAGTFALSAFAIATVRSRSRADSGESAGVGAWERIVAGIRAIAGSRAARILVAFVITTSFVYGTDTVLFVVLSKQRLGTGSNGYGTLLAALGVGGLLASFTTNRLAGSQRLGSILVGGLTLYTAPTILMLLVHDPGIAFVVQAARGAGTIIVDVLVITAIQRWAPKDVVGRVFGVVYSLAIGGIFLGTLITPGIVAVAGLSGALILFGAAPGLIAMSSLPRLRAMDRAAAARLEELRPAVELFGRLSIFAQAPRQVLEALAAAAERVAVPAGTAVVLQGEPATAFFAIDSGIMDVRLHEEGIVQSVAGLRPGDFFGEIGLIHEVPRTADVWAATDAVIYRLPGPEFLHAINDAPGARPTLLEGISSRLAVSSAVGAGRLSAIDGSEETGP